MTESDMILSVVPASERRLVESAYLRIVRKWKGRIKSESDVSLENPGKAKELDALIKDAMMSLVHDGVKSSLKKLSWTAYCLSGLIPDRESEPDPDSEIKKVVVFRLQTTDQFLTEYRELRTMEDGGCIQVVSNGVVKNVPRRFPMWKRERSNRVDSKEKAIRYYRAMLKERGVL